MDAARREALFEAVIVEIVENGSEMTSTAAIVAASGVSLEEFEAEFADTEEFLFATYEEIGERVLAAVRAGCASAESWPERVEGGLVALLGEIAGRPELARTVTRRFPAIDPSAYRLYAELVSKFAPLMSGGREHSEIGDRLPAEIELLAVGAGESLIFAEVDAGRAERLPRMLPEILFSVLVPFVGPERAGEAMRDAATKT